MSLLKKLFGLAAILALGTLAWVWLQPRTARDCAHSDSACLRKVAEKLITESLETGQEVRFISDEIRAAGRLLATEGTIDLAAQHDRLTAIGFGPRNIEAVYEGYFDALFDPTYPFDIPAAIAAEKGPGDSNLEGYLVAAFRLSLGDPALRATTLTLWDQHFDQLADSIPAGSTSHFVLSWLAQHDPTLGAKYFRRATDARVYVAGPGGWQVFFEIATFHCRAGRLDEGRGLLDALRAYFPPDRHIGLHLPAILDCYGEDAAVAAAEAALVSNAGRLAKALRDDPEKDDYVVSTVQDLSNDLRHGFAVWIYQQDRGEEVPALWSRYGAAEIAVRYLPGLDWLPARLAERQSVPVPDPAVLRVGEESLFGRLDRVAAEGDSNFTLVFKEGTTARMIELEWPAPQAIAAVKGLSQHSDGSASITAFVVGLERQLGCAPSDATMQALLADISAIKDPLDEARAIIELLRFVPLPVDDTAAESYDCIVK